MPRVLESFNIWDQLFVHVLQTRKYKQMQLIHQDMKKKKKKKRKSLYWRTLERFCSPGWRWHRFFHTETQTMCLAGTMIRVLAQNHHFDLKINTSTMAILVHKQPLPAKPKFNPKASLTQLSLICLLTLLVNMPSLSVWSWNSWVLLWVYNKLNASKEWMNKAFGKNSQIKWIVHFSTFLTFAVIFPVFPWGAFHSGR